MVKVYSNCPSAELFLNGESQGVRERNSQNFPAAGLRWIVNFREGENALKVVASKGDVSVEDDIVVNFQSQEWGDPAKFLLEEIHRSADTATVEAQLVDSNSIPCLDATNFVRFGLTGDGKLIDNQGTSRGSRKVQLYNGRAIIRVKLNGGNSVASISTDSITSSFCDLPYTEDKPQH
jgi:beta-galactosidase